MEKNIIKEDKRTLQSWQHIRHKRWYRKFTL